MGRQMKWFGSIVTSLVVLALSTLFLAYLQPIIRSLVPDEVLHAEVELSRWEQKPEKAGQTIQKPSDQKVIADAGKAVFRFRDWYDFAAIVIDNPTSKVIENVRVKFIDKSVRYALILSDDGLKRTSLKDISDIKLDTMKPGDRVKIFLWGDNDFPKSIIADQIRTFSSAGPFSLQFSAPTDNIYYESNDSPFFKFVDEWFGFALVAIFFILVIFVGAGMAYYEKYYKKLLVDKAFYEAESERLALDQDKFVPKL
jgi:hypothetical protein